MLRLRLLCWWLGCLALLALAPARVLAQEETIEWQISPGIGGAYRAKTWSPVVVTIANRGPDVRGTLEVRLPFDEDQIWKTAVDLPHNAEKRVLVPILQQNVIGDEASIEVLLRDGERVLKRERIRLIAFDSDRLVVGVLSDVENALPELSTLEHPQRFGTTHVVRLTSATLPEQALFLEMFDAIFVHAFDAQQLSQAQQQALQRWVAGGGRLVLSGDAYLVEAFAALAPATSDGTTQTVAPSTIASDGWKPRPNAKPFTLLRVQPHSGAQVLLRADDAPMLVQRSYGMGRVLLATFDLTALSNLGNVAEFWAHYLDLPSRLFSTELRDGTQWMLPQVLNIPALRLPSSAAVFGFLLLYIIAVGPLNYLVLRRFDRREWAYLTVPLLVLIFSVGAYQWGEFNRGHQPILAQLTLVQAKAAEASGQATSLLALFSPHRANYDLVVPGDAFATDVSSLQTNLNTRGVLYAEDGVHFDELRLGVGEIRLFAMEADVAVPPLEVTWAPDQQVTLHNRGEQPIEDVLLLDTDGRRTFVGTLAPGAQQTVTFQDDAAIVASDQLINRSLVVDNVQSLLFSHVASFARIVGAPEPGAAPAVTPQLFVLGWQPGAPMEARLTNAQARIERQIMYLWSAHKEE
ncbi:DUF7408 domain-containing protein [Kallotenue papyrolyticum]|uniref:DUF7408 domain-containing protein n=1 Tax=Kallotenue papyrolyticum TaxID=1325125 RepID=UPI0004785E56|nr:hypothetical protein [Kallotenue papyrolyticum]